MPTILYSRPGRRLALCAMLLCAPLALGLTATASAITSDNFNYAQPKTGFLSISPEQLSPLQSTFDDDYSKAPSLLAGEGCLGTGLNFPHRAKLKTLRVFYSRPEGAFPLVRMSRDEPGRAAQHFVDQPLAGPAGQVNEKVFSLGGSKEVVRNDNFTYSFDICLTDADDAFRGAIIEYTFTNAGD